VLRRVSAKKGTADVASALKLLLRPCLFRRAFRQSARRTGPTTGHERIVKINWIFRRVVQGSRNAKNLKRVLSFDPRPRPPLGGSEVGGLLLVHSVQKGRHTATPLQRFVGSSATALGGPPTRRTTGFTSQRAWLFSARSEGLYLREGREVSCRGASNRCLGPCTPVNGHTCPYSQLAPLAPGERTYLECSPP
jgi:hypothetical protein